MPQLTLDCGNKEGIKYSKLPDLESYGRESESKCFSGNLTMFEAGEQSSYCFKYDCEGSGSNTRLEINLGKQRIICTKKGLLKVVGYNGGINCPDPLEFCKTVGEKYCPRNCMGRGVCENNKCVCNQGFSGIDCSFSDI